MVVDESFYKLARAGAHQDLAGAGHVDISRGAGFQDEPQAGTVLRAECIGDQRGQLRTTDVHRIALACHRRITEHPEQVIAQLERDTRTVAEAAQCVLLAAAGAGEDRARLQRRLEGVVGGLGAGDRERVGERGRRRPDAERHVAQLAGCRDRQRPVQQVEQAQPPALVDVQTCDQRLCGVRSRSPARIPAALDQASAPCSATPHERAPA
nr:hypothetical protein [Microbacterium elymi]